MQRNLATKIQAKWESGLTAVWLKQDPPVYAWTTKNELYTGGSCLSQIFWEHENLSGLSIIQLIQLLLLKMNIQIKHCSTSKGSY